VLETVGIDVPAFDHNPTTGESLGLLVEEQRTNSIRNNTMVGAVAGTPGTIPTNWTRSNNNGLTANVVGTGTENGITYIDLQINGTTTGTGQTNIVLETATGIAATTGQTWSLSPYLKIQAGSLTNVGVVNLVLQENTALGTAVTAVAQAVTIPASSLGTYRPTFTGTLSGGVTVAALMPYIQININTGLVVDFTLRIGLPQLEQGAFATSPIPTTTAAVTRAADVASITGSAFSSWYRQDEGTVFADANSPTGGTHVTFDDGTVNTNRVVLYYQLVTDPRLFVASAGATSCIISAGTITSNSRARLVGAYKLDDFAASVNGLTSVLDALGNAPTGVDRARLGRSSGDGGYLNGCLRRFTFWPTRLSNASLQQITQ
jgi:hypothetical protein